MFPGSEDKVPEVFDPYGELLPDFENCYYENESDTFFVDGNPFPLTDNISMQKDNLVRQGLDPTNYIVENLKKDQEEKAPQSADEVLPERMFTVLEDGRIFFDDASFIGPTMRSIQNCKQKDLKGWMLLPVASSCRIRSRLSNHGTMTKVLFIPDEAVTDDVRALFYNY